MSHRSSSPRGLLTSKYSSSVSMFSARHTDTHFFPEPPGSRLHRIEDPILEEGITDDHLDESETIWTTKR